MSDNDTEVQQESQVKPKKPSSRGTIKSSTQVLEGYVEKFNETAILYRQTDPFLIAKQREASGSSDHEQQVEE